MESLKINGVHFGRNGVASSPRGVVWNTNYETWGIFGVISGRLKLYGTGGPEASVLMPLF